MPEQPDIDIRENYIKCLDTELLSILLKDRSSGKNIIWATDIYASKGASYDSWEPITAKLITGRFGKIIRPRIDKSQKEQKIRIKDKAEVFTPSWICNEMNNHLCDEWFEKKDVFNTAKDKTWIVDNNKIPFTNEKDKTWQDFVKLKVLEISCGEAPFLASRYNTTTGEWIDVNSRIGALDRKLRVINENCDSEQDWYHWTLAAYKSTFGYEWQGDSLLIARENLLFTFIDYYIAKFRVFPIKEYLIEIAKILSWNIWQMDGLKDVIPNSCEPVQKRQMSLFEDEETEPCLGCAKNDNSKHTGIYSRIMNWETKRSIKFFKGEKRMKFDFVIGNPPYQGENHQQIYTDFYLVGRNIAECVEMIFPIGWQDPKNANNLKKLNNQDVKEDRQIVFIDNKHNVFTGITGAEWTNVVLWKKNYNNKLDGKQRVLTNGKNPVIKNLIWDNSKIEKPKEIIELKNIVLSFNNTGFVSDYTSSLKPYGLRTDFFDDQEKYNLPKIQNCKTSEKAITIYGLENRHQTKKYITLDYPLPKKTSAFKKYKVFIGKAWGNFSRGYLGGAYSDIVIASPYEICTENFLESGMFEDYKTAKKHAKYLMTRFARALLFVNKNTQDNSKEKWINVPKQDYNEPFWDKSIDEIDEALMKKYNIPQEIREYIYKNIQQKSEQNIVNFEEMK